MKILVAKCPYCQPLHYPLAAQTFVSKEISSNSREDMFKVSLHFQLKRQFKTVFCCSGAITNKFMRSRRRNKILVQVRYHCTQENLPSFTFYICTQYRANHESKYIL
jgi:dTDP-4-dehydrorhamnose 3,5-epimerase-like enzyme